MREYREARFRFFRYTPDGKVIPTDDDVAKLFIPQARALLGEVKEQIALGLILQGQRRITLENGVRLEAHAMPGQDEMRISVPVFFEDENRKQERKEPEDAPFLWVSSRMAWDQVTDQQTIWSYAPYRVPYGMMVVEPGNNALICGYSMVWPYQFIRGTTTATLNPWRLGYNQPFYNPIRVDNDPYWSFSPDEQDKFYQHVVDMPAFNMNALPPPTGRYPYRFDDYDNLGYGGTVLVTKHGMISWYMYDTDGDEDYWVSQGYERARHWTQFPTDPLSSNGFSRTFPNDFAWPEYMMEWDHVVILDPKPGLGRASSKRDIDKRLLEAIQAKTGIREKGMVIPGEYAVKFTAKGIDCSTSTEPWPYTLGWNERQEYLAPIPVEVEVRVDRSGNNLQRSVIWFDQFSELYPNFAPFQGEDANGITLSNHGENWWQGAILANPTSRTIRVVEETYLPEGIFDTSINVGICTRIPCIIHVEVLAPYAFPWTLSTVDVAVNEIASKIYGFLGEIRQALWGMLSAAEITEAEIAAIVGTVVTDPATCYGVYFYNTEEKTFSRSPTTPNFPMWDYYDGATQRFLPVGNEWDTMFRWPTLNACMAFGFVALGSGANISRSVEVDDPDSIKELACW